MYVIILKYIGYMLPQELANDLCRAGCIYLIYLYEKNSLAKILFYPCYFVDTSHIYWLFCLCQGHSLLLLALPLRSSKTEYPTSIRDIFALSLSLTFSSTLPSRSLRQVTQCSHGSLLISSYFFFFDFG